MTENSTTNGVHAPAAAAAGAAPVINKVDVSTLSNMDFIVYFVSKKSNDRSAVAAWINKIKTQAE